MSFYLAFPYLLLLFINKFQYQVLSFIYIGSLHITTSPFLPATVTLS